MTTRSASGGAEVRLNGLTSHGDEFAQRFRRSILQGDLDETLISHCVVSAAGPVAEETYRRIVGLPPEDDGGCDLDRGAIQKIAARTGEGEPFVEEMYRRAREIVDANWTDIEALASGLSVYWHRGNEVGEFRAVVPSDAVEGILRNATRADTDGSGRPRQNT